MAVPGEERAEAGATGAALPTPPARSGRRQPCAARTRPAPRAPWYSRALVHRVRVLQRARPQARTQAIRRTVFRQFRTVTRQFRMVDLFIKQNCEDRILTNFRTHIGNY
jgi:hypothetical protein